MPAAGFEPTISAGERPQTYDVELAATGTGKYSYFWIDSTIPVDRRAE
jgi:hypothetical protein